MTPAAGSVNVAWSYVAGYVRACVELQTAKELVRTFFSLTRMKEKTHVTSFRDTCCVWQNEPSRGVECTLRASFMVTSGWLGVLAVHTVRVTKDETHGPSSANLLRGIRDMYDLCRREDVW